MRVLYNTNGFMFKKREHNLSKEIRYIYMKKMALLIVEYIQINMCI